MVELMNSIVACPTKVFVGKKRDGTNKYFSINLNSYRNAHWAVLDKAKKEFYRVVREQVRALPVYNTVGVTFFLHPKTKRGIDTSNVCSIAEKFLMDAVVSEKRLPDDDYTHQIKTVYLFGGVDKINPRVDAVFIGS